MVSSKSFRNWAKSFTGVTEQPHHNKTSFRVQKKIFATLDEKYRRCSLVLPSVEQSVYCTYDKEIFHPATGAWGRQGWTIIELSQVPAAMLKEALKKAYNHISG